MPVGVPPRNRRRIQQGPTVKILGFDSWTGGAFNFQRLVPALAERGMTLTVVHIGSWGSDPGRPSVEKIGDVEFRDVSLYPGKSFDEILEIEQPAAVLMLSTQTFAHRAFLRYCKQRAIPTLHLYHGIANVQVTDDEVGSHRIGRLAYAKYVLPKLGKLVRRTFPCYMRALLNTGATVGEWNRFISDVARMARGVPSLVASVDARTTKGAVYTNADIEQAVRVYGFRADDVVPVGNPDLIRFGFDATLLGALNRRDTIDLPYVMYVDTALAIVGLLFKSEQSFVEHLAQTAESLASQGKKMAFKPHPAHDRAYLQTALRGTGIEIVENEEFVAKLKQCCACIAETTSLALLPALLGIPLLHAMYGELRDQRFGRVLTSYPRGHALRDLANVSTILKEDAERFDQEAVEEWMAMNSGPLPASEMPRRVVAIIESMAAEAVVRRVGANGVRLSPSASAPCSDSTGIERRL
jgi:hypothetical protein